VGVGVGIVAAQSSQSARQQRQLAASRAFLQLRQSAARAIGRSRSVVVAPALIAHFRVFRTARAYDLSQVEAGLGPAAARSLAGQGVNVARARFVNIGGGVWVIPGRDQVCLKNGDGGSCGPVLTGPAPAEDGGMFFSTGHRLIGLAPDGNSTVTLEKVHGREVVRVVDNVYLGSTVGLRAISLRNASGRLTSFSLG
jgi:hypothetical protein